jgi:hypothetical protein
MEVDARIALPRALFSMVTVSPVLRSVATGTKGNLRVLDPFDLHVLVHELLLRLP